MFVTGTPRTRPSVGFSAMVLTVESPMCCATSHTIVVVSPSSVRSISSAVWISGISSSDGKSTSTTGPMTRTTLPVAFPCFLSAIVRFSLFLGS